jgi:hypothetical protein
MLPMHRYLHHAKSFRYVLVHSSEARVKPHTQSWSSFTASEGSWHGFWRCALQRASQQRAALRGPQSADAACYVRLGCVPLRPATLRRRCAAPQPQQRRPSNAAPQPHPTTPTHKLHPDNPTPQSRLQPAQPTALTPARPAQRPQSTALPRGCSKNAAKTGARRPAEHTRSRVRPAQLRPVGRAFQPAA